MPIYAYRCASCGHAQDVLQKISDDVLTVCPACGAASFVKQLTAAGFQLKGSGWYATDFRGGNTGAKDAAKEGVADGAKEPAPGSTADAAKAGAPATDKSSGAAPAATADAAKPAAAPAVAPKPGAAKPGAPKAGA
ncbi:MAG: zinc ribbon domain-containing protein [Rubrivivax sp.]|nr:zinc ribbon domain-containing protein [Rubrivivax sp.]